MYSNPCLARAWMHARARRVGQVMQCVLRASHVHCLPAAAVTRKILASDIDDVVTVSDLVSTVGSARRVFTHTYALVGYVSVFQALLLVSIPPLQFLMLPNTYRLVFKSAIAPSVLRVDYEKGRARFESDSVSTVSTVKEWMTRHATQQGFEIDVEVAASRGPVLPHCWAHSVRSLTRALLWRNNTAVFDLFRKFLRMSTVQVVQMHHWPVCRRTTATFCRTQMTLLLAI